MFSYGYDNDDYDVEMNIVNIFFLLFNGLENFYIGFVRDFDEDSVGFYFFWFIVGYYGLILKRLVVY